MVETIINTNKVSFKCSEDEMISTAVKYAVVETLRQHCIKLSSSDNEQLQHLCQRYDEIADRLENSIGEDGEEPKEEFESFSIILSKEPLEEY